MMKNKFSKTRLRMGKSGETEKRKDSRSCESSYEADDILFDVSSEMIPSEDESEEKID